MSAFDDAVFIWDPGSGVTASTDTVNTVTASGLTEGAVETIGSRTARRYSSGEGSRFTYGTAPFDVAGGATMMCVFQMNASTNTAYFWAGNGGSTQDHCGINWNDDYGGSNNVEGVGAQFRSGGSSKGSTSWAATWTAQTHGTSPRVIVATFATSGNDCTIVCYADGTELATDTSSYGSPPSLTVNRITVGQHDDSSPRAANEGAVLAAAVWDRVLTSGEIAAVSADPYNEGLGVSRLRGRSVAGVGKLLVTGG